MTEKKTIPSLGVNIAILQEDRILLTRREDFDVWCMPGGGVDEGESLAEAALREAREETGLAVKLVRLVGIYSRPTWRTDSSHVVVFAALPLGGELLPQPGEVVEAQYFSRDDLPGALLIGQHQRIQDALDGVCGCVWVQDMEWPFQRTLSRDEIYARRDQSGLSRREYYLETFGNYHPEDERIEVEGLRVPDARAKGPISPRFER